MDIIPFLGLLLTVFVTLAAIFVPIWLRNRRYEIRWVSLPPASLMEIADDVSTRLETTFDGRPIKNITKFTFILHNSGRELLDAESIVRPLTWTGPGPVLDARIVTSLPPVELDIDASGSCVEMSWALFNQRCQALIEIICESDSEPDRGEISGQIRNVSEIKEKEIVFVDEEDVRKRIRNNFAQYPKIFRYIVPERLGVLSQRYMKKLLALYIYLSVVILSFALVDDFAITNPSLLILIGLALFAITMAMTLYVMQNPYSKLLRGRSRQRGNRPGNVSL